MRELESLQQLKQTQTLTQSLILKVQLSQNLFALLGYLLWEGYFVSMPNSFWIALLKPSMRIGWSSG